MSEDERKIRGIIQTWMSATKAGDTAKVLSLMAPDVVFLIAGQPPMRGRQAFAEMSKGMKGMNFEGSSDVQEIQVFGNLAYCWAQLKVTIIPPQGERMERAGPVLSIFRKEQNGEWVLFRDANMLTSVE
jgi:uncharacterized protein (TIGR02246 family)